MVSGLLNVSVVFADFVPLTVAGQRWSYTIFPGHSKTCDTTCLSVLYSCQDGLYTTLCHLSTPAQRVVTD